MNITPRFFTIAIAFAVIVLTLSLFSPTAEAAIDITTEFDSVKAAVTIKNPGLTTAAINILNGKFTAKSADSYKAPIAYLIGELKDKSEDNRKAVGESLYALMRHPKLTGSEKHALEELDKTKKSTKDSTVKGGIASVAAFLKNKYGKNAPAGLATLAKAGSGGKENQAEKNFFDKYGMFHSGVAVLNPYKIIKDSGSSTGLSLESSGETDTNLFVEIALRKRNAWTGDPEGHRLDLEWKNSFYNDSNGKSGASGIAGTSNFNSEFNVGYNLCSSLNSDDWCGWKSDGLDYTLNIEGLYGITTDHSSQDTHDYVAGGFVFAAGWESKKDKRNEALAGIYYGEIDTPSLVPDTLEVKTRLGELPKFERTQVVILRGAYNIPIGDSGYLTFSYRTHLDPHSDSKITPWVAHIGVTVPLDKLVEKTIALVKTPLDALSDDSSKDNN